jgi:LysM repeat protein
MGGKIIAGVVGFVVLVLLVQNYVLGDGEPGGQTLGRTGAVPTATLPAQTPVAVSLGAVQPGGGSSNGGGATSGPSTYVVQSGDTLGTIASSFNVAAENQAAWIAEVLDLNGIADARLLQAGQELLLPDTPASGGQTPSATGSNPIVTATPGGSTGSGGGGGGGTYVVVSGDTPFGIAEKFCVEGAAAWVNELVALNNVNPNNLTLGQELELPAGTPPMCQ